MINEKRIKILLLVAEAWRDDSAGGNVINNLFRNMNAEFAQIYCSAELPHNATCKLYYQITDKETIASFFNRKPVGRILNINSIEQELINNEASERKLLAFFKKYRWNIFILIKSICWRYCNWKTSQLNKFIIDFDPDVIFAPCYAFPFQLALTRHVSELTNKKIVTYSGDDNYSLKQWSISPIYWINRIWNRYCLRKTYPYYDTFYSMSEDEINEMSKVTKKDMKILRKGIIIPPKIKIREVHSPIRMIYAGGLYIERWKILAKIGKVLSNVNKDGVKIILNIYSNTELSRKQKSLLNDDKNIFLHSSVSRECLENLYNESDIALHCESMILKNRLTTRLSFSTKIVDCLASGCAVIAIAWKEHTGLKYLKKYDAAICITELNLIEDQIRLIVNHPEIIKNYAEKAYICAQKNHDIQRIQNGLYNEMLSLI